MLVNIAGVAGFALSLVLAVIQIVEHRLSVRIDECTLINHKGSTFLLVCITNKTRVPFSLINAHLKLERKSTAIEFEKTVRTFKQPANGDRAEVKPVVLSQVFPARFDAYASRLILFEALNQHIDTKFLLPDFPVHNQTGLLPRLSHHIHTLCIHQRLPALMLNTSRGRYAVTLHVDSVQEWEWLRQYAVRKAASEEKIIFPD